MAVNETDKQRDERFERENDLRTLVDAGKIKADPKRFKRAMKEARTQRTALAKVGKADG